MYELPKTLVGVRELFFEVFEILNFVKEIWIIPVSLWNFCFFSNLVWQIWWAKSSGELVSSQQKQNSLGKQTFLSHPCAQLQITRELQFLKVKTQISWNTRILQCQPCHTKCWASVHSCLEFMVSVKDSRHHSKTGRFAGESASFWAGFRIFGGKCTFSSSTQVNQRRKVHRMTAFGSLVLSNPM